MFFTRLQYLIFSILFICYANDPHVNQAINETVAVLDIQSPVLSDSEQKTLTQKLQGEVVSICNCTVVERERVDEILKEQNLYNTGCITDQCAITVGQLLGSKLILATSIGKIEQLYSISSRLIDIQSGRIIKQITIEFDCNKEILLKSGIRELIGSIWTDTLSNPVSATSIAKAFLSSIYQKDIKGALKFVGEKDRLEFETAISEAPFTVTPNPTVSVNYGKDILTAEVSIIGTEIGFDLEYSNGRWWVVK